MMFTDALTRSGEDDSTAERILKGLTNSCGTSDVVNGLRDLVTTKVNLSRVLRRRGREADAKTLS
ncbi:hypothetical protein DAEQUDRAFT_33947 [Daedalea quercina L-15889]|uniref:Uncharacterized protein n=1 Tax=Daedalea quercina L-15889 TaxID=1314783 RepID=A0A165SRQ4_9APHY|nr:hypothetical protein DAEQUDRAFT_33947 [Daedalea quercina L-15889]